MSIRVIARLDIKGPNLVKGVHLEGLRVLGKPERFARYYYENGADELIYMDVVASLYGRNSLLDIIERTSKEIFIPLTVGGGLRTVDDIRTVLRAGADKVAINTAAVQRPELIREASLAFGSSTILVSIEAIKQPDGSYEAYVDYGRQSTGVNVIQWAVKAVELGAGELMVTSIDNEGTGKGYDLELTRQVAELVPVPVIASGGAGRVEHVLDVVRQGHADAVSMASILHYNYIRHHRTEDSDFSTEGNVEFLHGRRGGVQFGRVADTTLADIKTAMARQSIPCRYG
ncbi:MAG: imidazole glycerol phosphate synthase cyclase subunit [Verrucomicrobiota bacterium]